MNIYFSCSLTGGRDDQAAYAAIVEHLLARGHQVPTAHLAEAGVMDLERVVEAAEIYQRDIGWIQECQAVVAEVSTPSHGVGYEIAFAVGLKKPVLCCYRKDARVSKMITGNDSPTLALLAYDEIAQALAGIDAFLDGLR